MRKNIIKFLICILTICGFCGLLNIKTAKALEIPDSVGGTFKIFGASVRNSSMEEDLSGIRFTTQISQKAYNDIIAFANGKTVKFGTEISRADKLNSVSVDIRNISTNPNKNESKPKYKTSSDSEIYEYYASIFV